MKNELQVEKIIPKSVEEVFRAIGEGRLFLNCSGSNETLKIDFKVGGKYHVDFIGHDMSNHGEFLEIIPNQKIVFTWCQDAEVSAKPDTTVTILFKNQEGKTHILLTHTGFRDQEITEQHRGGWSGGLEDLGAEICTGKLKLTRFFKVPVTTLYEKCKNPASFFGMMGDVSKGKVEFHVGGQYQVPTRNGEIKGKFLEIIPNEKIVFTWESAPCGEKLTHDTKVTLTFEAEDEKESWLSLMHEGLDFESQQKSHREGWDKLTIEMMRAAR